MRRPWAATAAVLVLVAVGCTGQSAPPASSGSTTVSPSTDGSATSREARWAEDIQTLVDQMRSLHPDLFHGISEDTFDRTADALVGDLARLSDDQILTGIMHLVAMISAQGRDGHMGVWPPDNPDAVHRFPIRIWEFPDGLFVTDARPPNADLIGSKIIAVDGVPLRQVFRRLDPVVPRDNASNLRAARSVFLTSAEVLVGLGITDDPHAITLDVRGPSGSRRSATVEAVDADTYADWVGGWELLLPPRPGLRFLGGGDAPVVRYLPASEALYVRYDVVQESSAALAERIESAMRGHHVDRLVLDLRSNGGGEAGGYRALLRSLSEPRFDRPGRLVVLIGRLTFSAGTSLTVLLQRQVPNATLIGEDSGGAPNFWADPDTIELPNSGLRALIATRYIGIGGPHDRRMTVVPDVAVAFTSSDYFAGRDPALEEALRAQP